MTAPIATPADLARLPVGTPVWCADGKVRERWEWGGVRRGLCLREFSGHLTRDTDPLDALARLLPAIVVEFHLAPRWLLGIDEPTDPEERAAFHAQLAADRRLVEWIACGDDGCYPA